MITTLCNNVNLDGTITRNHLDRNNSSLGTICLHKKDQYLTLGYDYDPANIKTFMFRIYDKNGAIIYDNNDDKGELFEWGMYAERISDDTYSVSSVTNGIRTYKETPSVSSPSGYTYNKLAEVLAKPEHDPSCLKNPTFPGKEPYTGPAPVYKSIPGGYFAASRLASDS